VVLYKSQGTKDQLLLAGLTELSVVVGGMLAVVEEFVVTGVLELEPLPNRSSQKEACEI
jgi:hypothetical protein